MDVLQVVSTALAAVAAFLAFRSTKEASHATSAIERELELTRDAGRYQLFRDLEREYRDQYGAIWKELGPWDDPKPVDPAQRRVVHDLLQALASVHMAHTLELVEDKQADYLGELFLDWLRKEKAQTIWDDIFKVQDDTWPPGFVEFVDERIKDRPQRPR